MLLLHLQQSPRKQRQVGTNITRRQADIIKQLCYTYKYINRNNSAINDYEIITVYKNKTFCKSCQTMTSKG